MKVLVTGAAGFIGSHVADLFVENGWEVLGIDILHPAAHRDVPVYLNPQMDFVRVDLADDGRVSRLAKQVDAVCHQAAMVGLGESFDDAPDYVRANDLGTAVLLRALFRAGFSGRFVLASSMAVYGEGAYRCLDHGIVRPLHRREEDLVHGLFDPLCPSCGRGLAPVAITEEFAPDPRNVYASTKLHQEHLCFSFGRETGAGIVALRYHNVYGPRMPADTPYSGVAAAFRTAIEKGQAPEVFEDGRQLRDFIHVRDVAEANLSALSHHTVQGPFNIATGTPHSVGEMALRLWEADPGGGPAPEITGRFRAGDVRHVFASSEKANEAFGFSAGIDFRRGMELFAGDALRGESTPDQGLLTPTAFHRSSDQR